VTTSRRLRTALASAAAVAVIVADPLMAAQTAHAQYPPTPPSLSIDATGIAGDQLSFTAMGFAANQQVVAELLSRATVLGTFFADSEGTVSGTVVIPADTEPGQHTFRLTARDPDRVLSAVLIVLPPSPRLPADGRFPPDGQHRPDGQHPTPTGQLPADGRFPPDGQHQSDGQHPTPTGQHRPDGQLPTTGFDGRTFVLSSAAVGLIAVGGGAVVMVRRRRTRR